MTTGEASGQTCHLDPATVMMVTIHAGTKTHRKLATGVVFHQAFREIEGRPQIHGPTFLPIRDRLLMANGVVGPCRRNTAKANMQNGLVERHVGGRLLERTPFRMATKDARSKAQGIHATI
jgi:hypothetical protein